MSDFDNSLSWSNLLCQEDETSCFNGSNSPFSFQELSFESSSCSSVLESEEVEYIEKMVEMEAISSPCSVENCYVANYSWLKCARLDAITWIFNTRAIFGFRFHTACLSVTYFDRFLSKRSIDEGKLWAVRLLSVACLSLAAKMEECRVPALSEFSMEDYCFENKVIRRMELLVLNTLEWKMVSVTPFSYLHYFFSKIYGDSRPKESIFRVVESILAVIKEINLLDHRSSVIAVAAVLAASDHQLTRQELELKMNLIPSWGSSQIEHIFSWYIIMKEIEMGKLKTPKQVISPTNSSSIQSNSIAFPDNSSSTTFGAGTKRRLAYNDTDQNCPIKKSRH